MINAKEARTIAEDSFANITKYLDLIDVEIRTVAAEGKRFYECYVEDLWNTAPTNYSVPLMSSLQRRVKDELMTHGYVVQWGRAGKIYIPRGLEDTELAVEHQNVCMRIGW
jgi:hypothetical protein